MKNFFQKNSKKLVAAGLSVVGATASQAAVAFDEATGKFTGALEMGAYYSGVEIAIGVVGVTLATGLVFKALSKAK